MFLGIVIGIAIGLVVGFITGLVFKSRYTTARLETMNYLLNKELELYMNPLDSTHIRTAKELQELNAMAKQQDELYKTHVLGDRRNE